MEFSAIERDAAAFQRSITEGQINAIFSRVFGAQSVITSVVELGLGMYNNTYRVEFATGSPVILRVAPRIAQQARSERQLMRNEYVSIPHLAPIASLMPSTLAADFTHDLIDRDYLVQTVVPGAPAPDVLGRYSREEWATFFRQMGEITQRIHAVRGPAFGPVNGPSFAMWSEALEAGFTDIAADLDSHGLDSADVLLLARATRVHREALDEITEPRLLHGDLWTANVMLDPDAPTPTITGVVDCDRTWWGDPEADWTMFMARKRPGTERDAFWEAYPHRSVTEASELRAHFYRARHIGAIRLERHRLGNWSELPSTYEEMSGVLSALNVS